MMTGEEVDNVALERVCEECCVGRERRSDLQPARPRGIAETVEGPEDDVAEDGDGEKS